MRKSICLRMLSFALGVGFIVSSAVSVRAQGPGAPPYLHALSDLRLARAYIQADNRVGVDNARHHAIKEIERAIDEIKRAAIDDGKDPYYSPPVDARQVPTGPLHEALRLLRKAYQDCSGGADLPNAAGMKDRALGHIQDARDTLARVVEMR